MSATLGTNNQVGNRAFQEFNRLIQKSHCLKETQSLKASMYFPTTVTQFDIFLHLKKLFLREGQSLVARTLEFISDLVFRLWWQMLKTWLCMVLLNCGRKKPKSSPVDKELLIIWYNANAFKYVSHVDEHTCMCKMHRMPRLTMYVPTLFASYLSHISNSFVKRILNFCFDPCTLN